MKEKVGTSILLVLLFLVTACGAAPKPAATSWAEDEGMAAATEPPAISAPEAPAAGDQPQEAITYEVAAGQNVSNLMTSNRMIIKNADIRLQVNDTDVAVDGVTQIAGDVGGYIISSRTWYQNINGQSMKYSSITIGVPADQFEFAMRRLRALAVKVMDENASGDDVTDQYVDLQSQLQNLEATRARLLVFLNEAKTVAEALQVNQELSKIEQQIEEIKGRMNYLQNRSAYSTVTIELEPVPPVIPPTPTRTPVPTATPVQWKPGETFKTASHSLVTVYQVLINVLIWIVVVIVPFVAPPVLLGWGIWYLVKRRKKKQ
jgi:Domain of unknown function (DUF4349)